MTVTEINNSTIRSDTTIFLRDSILDAVTDPITGKREASSKFVMTSYPQREATYPIITVKVKNMDQLQRMGMQSEETSVSLLVEIRVWGRNVKERDELGDDVYEFLRTAQYGTPSTVDANLHDFNLLSSVLVDEPDVKSLLMEINYLYVSG